MYVISVLVGRAQPLVWALAFRDEQNALAVLGRLRDQGDVDVQDEYGQRLCARGGDLGPIMFENTEESRAATIERTLNEQRIRAMVVNRMQGDHTFRQAANGPQVLTPMNGMVRG